MKLTLYLIYNVARDGVECSYSLRFRPGWKGHTAPPYGHHNTLGESGRLISFRKILRPNKKSALQLLIFYSGKLHIDVTKFQTDPRGIEPELAEGHKERST